MKERIKKIFYAEYNSNLKTNTFLDETLYSKIKLLNFMLTLTFLLALMVFLEAVLISLNISKPDILIIRHLIFSFLIIVYLVIIGIRHSPIKELTIKKPSSKGIRNSFIVFIYKLFFCTSLLIINYNILNILGKNLDNTSYINTSSMYTLKFILVGIIAPIEEELFYRGLLITIFIKFLMVIKNFLEVIDLPKKFIPSNQVLITVSVILSAIFFAAVHGSNRYIDTFFFAIIATLIYFKTKNLIYPILIHSMNNLLYLSNFEHGVSIFDTKNYLQNFRISIIISIILFLIGIHIYIKNKPIIST